MRVNNLEQLEQIRLVKWFHETYPEFADDLHHFANERKCSLRQGHLLKLMGVKRGVCDIHIGIVTKQYAGLWLELKVEKGKLTKEQISFINRKNQKGYFAIAVWGFDASRQVILEYLKDYKQENVTKSG